MQAAKLHYNLGRFMEGAGQPGKAAEHYRASLALRPHPVVKKRLEALKPAPTTP